MLKKVIWFIFLGMVSSCASVHKQLSPMSAPAAQVSLPDTRAFKQASELISVINIGEKGAITRYLGSHAVASVQKDYADFLVMVHRDTIKLRVEKLEKASDPNTAKLKLTSEVTGLPMDFSITIDSNPPHLITAIHLDFADVEMPKLTPAQARLELQKFFDSVCKADLFSGSVLLAQNDAVLFQGACGEANKDFQAPNTIDTKFNLGSMNKMFTAVAIAQLMEQGKLSFDDPLAKFMPTFPDKKSAKQIKISHLLSHTSGLGSYFNEKYNATPKDRLKTIDDFLSLVKDQKLDFAPGAKWQYSNTGFLVLGKVIEIITGKSYFDYVDEHIYKQAGMSQSGSFDLTQVNRNLAVGYNKEYEKGRYEFTNNLFSHVVKGGPAGGGYSTAGDLLKFSQALQQNKLIKRETLARLTTPNALNDGYGLGFAIRPNSFGHGGGFVGISSELSIYPKSGLSAITLSNYSGGDMLVAVKLRQIIAGLTKEVLQMTEQKTNAMIDQFNETEDYFGAALSLHQKDFGPAASAYASDVVDSPLNVLVIKQPVSSIENVLSETEAFFSATKALWCVVMRADLMKLGYHDALAKRGFLPSEKSVAMALPLSDYKPASAQEPGCENMDHRLSEWLIPLKAFPSSEHEVPLSYQKPHELALKRGKNVTHLSLFDNGQIVSSVTLSLRKNWARIDDLATLIDFRAKVMLRA